MGLRLLTFALGELCGAETIPPSKSLRRLEQFIWVKEKVYVCLGRCIAPANRSASLWSVRSGSLCVLDGEERAFVTKHVLVNGTYGHISKEMGLACDELGACAVTKLSVVF